MTLALLQTYNSTYSVAVAMFDPRIVYSDAPLFVYGWGECPICTTARELLPQLIASTDFVKLPLMLGAGSTGHL